MLTRISRTFSLYFNPPKVGDVFYGDPVWFIISRPIELVLHGLKDKFGTNLYDPIPSQGCFRFTVESTAMPYYRMTSEVLCKHKFTEKPIWMKRSQPRRIPKEMFRELFLMGLIWREA